MAKDKIVLAELDIDTANMVKSMASAVKEIENLVKKQEKLIAKGDESSKKFIANEAEIKRLEAAYKSQQAAISAQTQAVAASSGSFGEYRKQVADSFAQINILNGGMGAFTQRAKEAGGTGPLITGALSGMTVGIKGMGAAIMANPLGAILKVIILVVEELYDAFKDFTPVVNAVQQGLAAMGAVVESVKNSILDFVVGGKSFIDFFTGFAGAAADAAAGAVKLEQAQQRLADKTELQAVANEKAKNSIAAYIAASQDQNASDDDRIKAMENALKTEQSNFKQRKFIAEETHRLAVAAISNGKNLTAQEIKDLTEKGAEYAKQLAKKKIIAAEDVEALRNAQAEREKIYGEEASLNVRQADDLKKIQADIKAENDANAALDMQRRQKVMDDALEKQKQLLDLFVAEGGARSKTLAEQLQYEKDFSAKSIALLKTELQQKKISQLEYRAAILGITQQEAQNRAQVTGDFARAELALWIQQNQSKIESGKAFTEAMKNEEVARLDDINEKNAAILEAESNLEYKIVLARQLRNETLTQKETVFLTEMLRLNQEYTTQKAALEKGYEDAKEAQEDKKKKTEKAGRDEKAAQIQTDLDDKMTLATTQLEQDMINEDMKYEAEKAKLDERLALNLISDKQYTDLLGAEDKKRTDNKKALEQAAADHKLGLAASTFGSLAAIMGKESAAGKAMAVAQATIDTYKSAVSAYSSMSGIPIVGPALGAVAAAAAVAAGIANIKKITSTKAPKAEKGALFTIGGNRHSAGGTLFKGADGTQFEAEQGELIGVMNRNAASHFMAFNNAFPAGSTATPNYFAGGGIVSRDIAAPSLNIDELAAKIALANSAIPAPVVAVQDIIARGDSYVKVRDGANF